MVLICSLIFNSSNPHSKPLGTVPGAPITIGITITFMFHNFFNFLARSKHLFLFSLSLFFIMWSAGTVKSTIRQVLIFLSIITKSGLLARIKGSVSFSKYSILWVSFSRMDSGLCTYSLEAGSDFYFLHSSQWIPFPTQLCQVLLH